MLPEANKHLQILTVFFGLSVEQQKITLPVLQIEKLYDFPDGDWRTDEAIEVLIMAYAACLNSFSNTSLIQDANKDESLENLIEELLVTIQSIEIGERKADVNSKLESFKFETLRHQSIILENKLQMKILINKDTLSNLINFYIHA